MQSLSNFSGIFHRTKTKNITICIEAQKILNSKSNLEKEKTELEESNSLTSVYTTRLQSLRQYDAGMKAEI